MKLTAPSALLPVKLWLKEFLLSATNKDRMQSEWVKFDD